MIAVFFRPLSKDVPCTRNSLGEGETGLTEQAFFALTYSLLELAAADEMLLSILADEIMLLSVALTIISLESRTLVKFLPNLIR